MVVYKNCGYFGLESERVPSPKITESECNDLNEESKFIVSNEWQDKALGTGVNFCHKAFADFHFVVEFINEFIQKAKVDANAVPEVTQAYPMLRLLGRVHGHFDYLEIDGLTGNTANANNCTAATDCGVAPTVSSQTQAHAQIQPIIEVASSSVVFDTGGSSCCDDPDDHYDCAIRGHPIALARRTYSDSPSLLVDC
jgi:hypothetical protein